MTTFLFPDHAVMESILQQYIKGIQCSNGYKEMSVVQQNSLLAIICHGQDRLDCVHVRYANSDYLR